MAYELQPGTLPHRVVNWLKLQPIGGEFSSAQIAEEIGASLEGFASTLQTAKSHGVLRMRKELRVCYWSLGDGTPEPRPFDLERDEPLHTKPVVEPVKTRLPAFKLRTPNADTPAPKLLPSGPVVPLAAEQDPTQLLHMTFSNKDVFQIQKGIHCLRLDLSEAQAIADFVGRISCN